MCEGDVAMASDDERRRACAGSYGDGPLSPGGFEWQQPWKFDISHHIPISLTRSLKKCTGGRLPSLIMQVSVSLDMIY